ncbi:MAG: hypothetical protein GWP91_23650 [Rhodobacterales bacterium]|nr:hypothetical protein [Rhodobacterales bacterium]
MADLITHMASVLLPASLIGGRYVPAVTFGVVLPDLAARMPGEVLEQLDIAGISVPDVLIMGWSILHMPIPYALMCTAIAMGFAARDRRGVWLSLLMGGAIHFAVDILQDHHGLGYLLLYPFSEGRFELGLIHSEATVSFAPWLGLLTVICWAIRWQKTTDVTDSRQD